MPKNQRKINYPGINTRDGKRAEIAENEEKYVIPENGTEEYKEEGDLEEGADSHDDFLDEENVSPVSFPQVQAPSVYHSPKSETLTKVEKILEKDLGYIYFKMPDDAKMSFKIKGEEISLKIEGMIEAGKVIARKILALIKSWLQIIPGVNKFFVEQEAKIKADEIMEYVEREKKNIDI